MPESTGTSAIPKIAAVESQDATFESLLNDKPEVLTASGASKRKRAASEEKYLELESNSEMKQQPANKRKTTLREVEQKTALPKRVNRTTSIASTSIRHTSFVNSTAKRHGLSTGVQKLLKSLKKEGNAGRPLAPSARLTNQIPQKVSLGAQIATPWDPFSHRKAAEEVITLEKKTQDKHLPDDAKPTTRFQSWKDPEDESITWKVFPKTTPRMKHRGGNIVVENLLKNPAEHPDILIEEYEKDPKCWIARVEDVDEQTLAGRRRELTRSAKNKQAQKARSGAATGRRQEANKTNARLIKLLKPKQTAVLPNQGGKSKVQTEADERAQKKFLEQRKMARAAKEKEMASQKTRSEMRLRGEDVDGDFFG
jgi:hypothetical protein